VDVREENIGSGDFDDEVGEDEVGEGDDRDVAETIDGGEGAKHGGKLGREVHGGGCGLKGQLGGTLM